jgi:hypothetical protein
MALRRFEHSGSSLMIVVPASACQQKLGFLAVFSRGGR